MAVTRNARHIHGQANSSQPHQEIVDDEGTVESLNEQGEIASNRKNGKKVRGPTFMCKVWGQHDGERSEVLFNNKGQPISNTSKLNHFLGTVARNGRYAPLHHKSWHKMPKVLKEDMFALVLQKFDFSPGHKRWILKSLGKKWKDWKARVKSEHYDPDLPIEEQIHSPPDRVQADQWKELVKYWDEDAKKGEHSISKKNKSSRARQQILYKKGKIPLAVMREAEEKKLNHEPSRAHMFFTCFSKNGEVLSEDMGKRLEKMHELSSQVPEGELDASAPNDVYSQVMGKEKSGSVRTYGLGVCPSDIWGEVPSSGTSYRISMEWKTQLDKTNLELDKTNLRVEELMHSLQQSRANEANSLNIPITSPNMSAASPNQHIPSSTSTAQQARVKVRDSVYFKSIADQIQVVGKGRIASMDPSTVVGGVELGANWCEILVQVPIIRDEHLMRPYGCLKTIEDAIGAPIAWPIALVVKDNDDGFFEMD